MKKILSTLAVLMMPFAASANSDNPHVGTIEKIEGHGKTAVIANERMKRGWYDGEFHFAPAVRAGDYVFLSGATANAGRDGAVLTRDEAKAAVKRMFDIIEASLIAAGGDMNSIVRIRSFHDFDNKHLELERVDQIRIIAEVKGEMMGEPHTAWTAVGTTALFSDVSFVEVEVDAYIPLKKD